ncbi:hypothetical protein [Nostoc sp. NMS8]|nr:hypothetical protein [Nostoc sp. NMS8]MBN3959482.1 hypothetical protein [Nostoc sp. NMS8]
MRFKLTIWTEVLILDILLTEDMWALAIANNGYIPDVSVLANSENI